jgi:hypothetical protein
VLDMVLPLASARGFVSAAHPDVHIIHEPPGIASYESRKLFSPIDPRG